MPDNFLFTRGPQGRGLFIDASGRLLINSNSAEQPFVFTFGDTGHPLSVDSSGRLLVSAEAGSGLGDIVGGLNLGAGSEVFAQENLNNLEFRTLIGEDNVTVSQVGNQIAISGNSNPPVAQRTSVSASGTNFTQVGQLPPGMYQTQLYRDEIYVGSHNFIGATSGAVYRFTLNGEHTGIDGPHVSLSPSGTILKMWAAQVFQEKLYWGTGEGIGIGGGIIYEHNPASGRDHWLSLGRPSGAASQAGFQGENDEFAIAGLAEYDGHLIITSVGHPNAVLGIQRVLKWDGSKPPGNPGGMSGVTGAFISKATGSFWGWSFNPTVAYGRLFLHGHFDPQVNVWDGNNLEARVGPTELFHEGAEEERPNVTVGYKGRIYQVGKNIYEWTDNEHRLAHQMESDNIHLSRPEIYNGKLYVGDGVGNIYRTDGNGWEQFDTVGASPMVGFVAQSGTLVAIASNGSVFAYREDITFARDVDKNQQTQALRENKLPGALQSFVGMPKLRADGPNEQPSDSALVQGFLRKPDYTSTNIVTQGNPLASGISELDVFVAGLGSSSLQSAYDGGNEIATTDVPVQMSGVASGVLKLLDTNLNIGPGFSPILEIVGSGDGATVLVTYQGEGANGKTFTINKTGTGGGDVLTVKNAGTGKGVLINQDGNRTALDIDSEATTQPLIVLRALNGSGNSRGDVAWLTDGTPRSVGRTVDPTSAREGDQWYNVEERVMKYRSDDDAGNITMGPGPSGILELKAFTDATRPTPNGQFLLIFNTDDGLLNIGSGNNWHDPTGALT